MHAACNKKSLISLFCIYGPGWLLYLYMSRFTKFSLFINCNNNALISTNNIDPIYVLLLWAALHSGDEISHSRVFITQLRNPNLERVVVIYVLENEEICCTTFFS